MARIEISSRYRYIVYYFVLTKANPISRIDSTTWIIREACEDFDFVAHGLQRFGETQTFEMRLWLKPLSDNQYTHRFPYLAVIAYPVARLRDTKFTLSRMGVHHVTVLYRVSYRKMCDTIAFHVLAADRWPEADLTCPVRQ